MIEIDLLSVCVRSRYGKRRPWLFVAAIGSIVANLFLWGFSEWAWPVCWLFALLAATLAKNMTMNTASAILADFVPTERGGVVAGIYSGMSAFGCAIGGRVLGCLYSCMMSTHIKHHDMESNIAGLHR